MTSKYDRLADGGPLGSIATLDAAVVTLTFAEVAVIVGPLPVQARSSAAWWGATASGRDDNIHVLHWWDAGYVADRPDFAAETVTFRRARSRDVEKRADRR